MPRLFSCIRKPCSVIDLDDGGLYDPAASTADNLADNHRRGGCAVVVELFSSQACKTFQEAEQLMWRLGQGEFTLDCQVIVLAFHVDRWDHLGWRDPFGCGQWSVRQKAYVEGMGGEEVFAPQVVVQGCVQSAGNEEENVLSHIVSAKRFPSPFLEANFKRPSPQSLQVSLSGPLRMSIGREGANVMVALYENGLVTNCTEGENQGLVLSNNYVVRGLHKLCSVKDFSAKKTVHGTVNFSLWKDFDATKCGLAVFLQTNSYQIFGSQKFDLPPNL